MAGGKVFGIVGGTCALRPSCLWFRQEGRAACLRCPQIVSETCGPSDALARAADPAAPVAWEPDF